MVCLHVQSLEPSLGVDGKQLIHSRYLVVVSFLAILSRLNGHNVENLRDCGIRREDLRTARIYSTIVNVIFPIGTFLGLVNHLILASLDSHSSDEAQL